MALTIALAAFARPAVAESDNAYVCENGTDSNRVIAACTPIIESGGAHDLSLALALDDRC